MDPHVQICEELFSAARSEFKHLEYFYFHNCVYERVWRDNRRRHVEPTPTWDVLHTYPHDYKAIFVGDASMSPYEIVNPGGSVEHWNDEAGITWLQRVLTVYPKIGMAQPDPRGVVGLHPLDRHDPADLRRAHVPAHPRRPRPGDALPEPVSASSVRAAKEAVFSSFRRRWTSVRVGDGGCGETGSHAGGVHSGGHHSGYRRCRGPGDGTREARRSWRKLREVCRVSGRRTDEETTGSSIRPGYHPAMRKGSIPIGTRR